MKNKATIKLAGKGLQMYLSTQQPTYRILLDIYYFVSIKQTCQFLPLSKGVINIFAVLPRTLIMRLTWLFKIMTSEEIKYGLNLFIIYQGGIWEDGFSFKVPDLTKFQ